MIYSADGTAVINAHLTDEAAHKDQFAKYLPLQGAQMTGAITAPESGELIKGYGATDTRYAKYTVGPYSHLLRAYGVNGGVFASALQLEPNQVVMNASHENTYCTIIMTPGGVELVCNSTVTTDNQLITKKYVDNAIQTAIQDTWEASY